MRWEQSDRKPIPDMALIQTFMETYPKAVCVFGEKCVPLHVYFGFFRKIRQI